MNSIIKEEYTNPMDDSERKLDSERIINPSGANKYVTFSVSASKDFKISMAKRHSSQMNSGRQENSTKIIDALTKILTDEITCEELFSKLKK